MSRRIPLPAVFAGDHLASVWRARFAASVFVFVSSSTPVPGTAASKAIP